MSFRNLPSCILKIDGRLNPLRVYHAAAFLSRVRGLLGSAPLNVDEALWIRPCGSIHTIGMRYPIDVLFLDRRQRVLSIASGVEPRCFAAQRRAHSALEVLGGTAALLTLDAGCNLAALCA